MTNEDNLIFLGYPDGYLQQVLAGGPVTSLASSETYGNRGLGRADYHQYKTGSHALYTRENVVADLASILSDFKPDDVFTTSEYDQPYNLQGSPDPGDHNATNQFVREALGEVVGSNPSYGPILHSGIVWTASPNETATVPTPTGTWPNAINPAQPFAPIPAHPTAIYPSWASRESIAVHNDLKNPILADNPKYRAIAKHETQGGTANPFLANFVHSDEVFWITEMGIAKLAVAVSGTGNFGTVPVGSPVSRSVTISNSGTKPLIISGVTLSGAGFSATALPAIGTSIAGGASVAATVTYLPTAATANSGALTITSDSGGSVTTELVGGGANPEPTVVVAPGAASRNGYWMLDAAGNVYAFGDAKSYGSAAQYLTPFTPATHLEPTPTGAGYWVVSSIGAVYAFGDAGVYGNATGLLPGEAVISLSAVPHGDGYWLFTNRGRVIAKGAANSFGDMSKTALNGPIVGSVATPTGNGYFMVASDGGIFAFGDATFRGSMGGTRLNKPVESLVPTEDNAGYWLVASDGGIFAFGSAAFRGSMGATTLNKPVVGMVRFGNGYLMVAEDGGIFSFSDKPFLGSLGGSPPATPVRAVAAL